jgi:NAD(P)-dependent dehydrogenase (short-subunit alcohol dehydrogenase family)
MARTDGDGRVCSSKTQGRLKRMSRRTALITGSSGLIGPEMVTLLDRKGWTVHGVDDNMRRDFFGPHGDTTPKLERLRDTQRYEHHHIDVRDRAWIMNLVTSVRGRGRFAAQAAAFRSAGPRLGQRTGTPEPTRQSRTTSARPRTAVQAPAIRAPLRWSFLWSVE